MKQHAYEAKIEWTGNDGDGTKTYKSYRRDHEISSSGKPPIQASSDPSFRGDRSRYNPEELLVASLSSCHMLSYLHLCAVNHITVYNYRDTASGLMRENEDGSGEFVKVTLNPQVTISSSDDQAQARSLHDQAHHLCFIARSVNFPVDIIPEISAKSG
jgi:organic hydroperoxide reductase OsmC/OhrA